MGCNSKKNCVKFNSEHCNDKMCGLGDGDCEADDGKGCAPGLTCGNNNCNKFHAIGEMTGFTSSTDCCHKPCLGKVCKPFCATKDQPWSEKCTWKDCCACTACGG